MVSGVASTSKSKVLAKEQSKALKKQSKTPKKQSIKKTGQQQIEAPVK
ncbi:8143_t:CDS:2 [Racocetra persica]|uniref:8143_t:CDS:1 n=1 Tax=Racocetra persica TaxID=160502 RepID=A0ACA9KRZ3_9GLOM|nr:8143_t:CDS:2 [Racocetra persica]